MTNKHDLDQPYKFLILVSILFVIGSLVLSYFASIYATKRASNPVDDLFLNILPAVDVTPIFIYGFILFCAFLLFLVIRSPRKLPFIFKSIALFVAIRSIFVVLTHTAPSPEIAVNYSSFDFILRRMILSGDLFFSGHTGFPFLMALLYWNHRSLRVFFIATAVFFGFIVLLGHLHYSIDVFSAFFITYGIYRLSQIFFKKELALFKRG
ncbi:sphingomyelin synthase family protein [Patescibacteria group bacterium]|nr:sphingomyelin synthase family protein [Patescibacteria group bacterium]